ncbi:HAD-IB family hydrolase [Litorimonas taeanensis]|nr:HAD-IB family hydrolase [Litorimonas taeanensis]
MSLPPSNMTNTAPFAAPESGLIVFDFDGTITTKDTFALFLRYYAGLLPWFFKVMRLMPVFMAYKLGRIDRHAVKAAVIKTFFKGETEENIFAKAQTFANDVIPPLIRPLAQECFDQKKQDIESLYICSASITPYLRHWAVQQGLPEDHVLAVELEFESGVATGRIAGYNVWGENKVRRIYQAFNSDYVHIKEAYGDTRGDLELLNAAEASYFKPFRLSPS